MRTRIQARPVTLVVVGLLCAAVGTAYANRGTIVNGEANYVTAWAPLEITAAGSTVRCNVTLEGSFAGKTFTKASSTVISNVLQASFGSCTGGRVSVLAETLPWTTDYVSFAGTLPFITQISVALTGAGISIEPTGLGSACLLRSEARAPIKGIAATSREVEGGLEIPTMRADETVRYALTGNFFCSASTGTLRGRGGELGGTTETAVVKLIQ